MVAMKEDQGQVTFWSSPPELIARYGKSSVHGPPLSVVASYDLDTADGLGQAIVGAQFAKAKRAVFHLMIEPSPNDKERLRTICDRLAEEVYVMPSGEVIAESTKVALADVGQMLSAGLSRLSQVLLSVGEYSTGTRYAYGQLGLYWFLNDSSLPVEYIPVADPFGRLLTVNCRVPAGRMSTVDSEGTAVFCALTVARALSRVVERNVLLVADPTGDLPGALLEALQVYAILQVVEGHATVLTGMKKFYGEGTDPDSAGAFSIGDFLELKLDLMGESRTFRVEPPPSDADRSAFLAGVRHATLIHFSGHGGVGIDGDAYLELSDGPLPLSSIGTLAQEPTVLLNACELGRISRESVARSVLSLLQSGARLVIAPLLAVEDSAASGFARLYGEFAFLPFALSFHLGRDALFLRQGDRLTDHLVYAFYGDPFLPTGGDQWEAYEAAQLSILTLIEAQKKTKEAVDLYARAAHLHRLSSNEAKGHLVVREPRLREEVSTAHDAHAHACDAWRLQLLAGVSNSGAERDALLSQSADEYVAAADRIGQTFNESLNRGYASYLLGCRDAEAAALAAAQGMERSQVERFVTAAMSHLDDALGRFREIQATGDAEACEKRRVALVRLLGALRAGSLDVQTAAITGLLHTGIPLR